MYATGTAGRTIVAMAALGLLAASCAQQHKAPPEQEVLSADQARDMAVKRAAGTIVGGRHIPQSFKFEEVTIETDDGYRLVGDMLRHHRFRRNALPAVIFLHSEGESRNLFHPVTLMTASAGMNVLAIDLRGHGQNPEAEGNPSKGPKDLTPEDYALMIDDIRNAISFLAVKGEVDGGRIGIVGTSLGANLALVAMAQPWAATVRSVVAISPTVDSHGIRPAESLRSLGATGANIHLVAGKEDKPSIDAARAFFELLRKPRELMEVEGDARGHDLYGAGLLRQIPTWLHEDLVKGFASQPR